MWRNVQQNSDQQYYLEKQLGQSRERALNKRVSIDDLEEIVLVIGGTSDKNVLAQEASTCYGQIMLLFIKQNLICVKIYYLYTAVASRY